MLSSARRRGSTPPAWPSATAPTTPSTKPRGCCCGGWACRCFLTDTGVRLLRDAALREMSQSGKLQLEVCEHAWQLFGGGPAPEGFKLRSQLQNAMLARDCDRVIVF